jgi:hypothetical protein
VLENVMRTGVSGKRIGSNAVGNLFAKMWKTALLLASVAFAHPLLSQNVVTYHNDNLRSGQTTAETILTPANVNAVSFGKKFSYTVDGYVYAQPLYVTNVAIPNKGTHNVLYVATEHDSIFALDADSNAGANAAPLWTTSFINPAKGINPVTSSEVSCGDLVPEIGVTGTPVIDAASRTLYVVAKTWERGQGVQRLHALDITTGAEKFGGPVLIKARVRGVGDGGSWVSFNALRENQRPALLLQNGLVYLSWASHCDIGAYHGWVMAYNATTLRQAGVWISTPNGLRGGVWQGGAGLAGDSSFNTYVSTGNGSFDANTGGTNFGDSLLKLSASSTGVSLVDYFTPYNEAALNNADADLGSGGILLLPDQPAGSPHLHLLAQAGKEGSIYLVDRDQMGHFNPSNDNQIVQFIPSVTGGIWGMPAWWNNNIYFGGTNDSLKVFSFNPATGLLSTSPTSFSSTVYGFPGPTPSVSANGTSNGIVWVLQTDAYGSNGPSILHAYDATNLATELYNSNQNSGRDGLSGAVKFSIPTIANGKVYVGTAGQLSVFGLLP